MNIITASVIKSTLRFTPRVHSKLDSLVVNQQKNQISENSFSLNERLNAKTLDLVEESLEKPSKKNQSKLRKQEDLDNKTEENVSESNKTTVKSENIHETILHKNAEKERSPCIVSKRRKPLEKDTEKEMDYCKVLENEENGNSAHSQVELNIMDDSSKKRKPKILESSQAAKQNIKELKKPKRKRSVSPINSEQLTIEPTEVKISDLCKDIRIGRKSVKFNEIRKMEAVKRKMKSKNDKLFSKNDLNKELDCETKNVLASDKNVQKTYLNVHNSKSLMIKNDNTNVTKYHLKGAPQVRVVNGKIVIDENSLQIDRRERDINPNTEIELVEENDLSRKVNSASWGKREKSDRWSKEDTQKFYNALSQWGTDFGLICKMFPNRSQRQIKNKFNSEEKKYPEKIDIAIKSRQPIDIVAYSKATGSNFRSINEIQEELRKAKEDFEESRRISIENAQISLENNK
ncbi:unnamed protein product [Pneumocystis jirovecii]|uniref:SANT domain-containing protein n=1 Tax=Pneumocystis jirovecii TaxID=42068 RepID=L0PGB2_PNEJI|nr:unnamed protein product [Pneumocystis jirovecii]